MKLVKRLMVLGLVAIIACGSAWAAKETSLVDGGVKKVAGWCSEKGSETWSINGKLIDGPAVVCYGDNWATWDVRGYDYFKGSIGVLDDQNGEKGTVTFEINGEVFKRVSQQHRQDATDVMIPLSGRQTLTIRWGGDTVYIINPTLVKGAVPSNTTSSSSSSGTTTYSSTNGTATTAGSSRKFSIDPSGLDRLAENLYQQCGRKPSVKQKVDSGRVAVSTLRLIGNLPKDCGESVVEDLSTAMIKSSFNLCERGQLDKILAELKISDTGLVDPATAQKIGKLSGCDLVLLGSISDQDSTVVINVRLMETATGNSVAAERVELKKIFTAGGAGS